MIELHEALDSGSIWVNPNHITFMVRKRYGRTKLECTYLNMTDDAHHKGDPICVEESPRYIARMIRESNGE